MAAPPRPLIAGNWKMNGLRADAVALAVSLKERVLAGRALSCDLLLCPPATVLHDVWGIIRRSPIALGGQDCHPEDSGAHTGDIGAPMLRDCGCSFVIVGHSERRTDHGETDALVRAKAAAALKAGLTPIVCVGETLAERDQGRALAVVGRQLEGSLPEPSAGGIAVAYEPVWAIGTGRTPSNSDIAAVHAHIRAALEAAARPTTRILYGGSVKPGNAGEILALPNVNGALVGGASLKAHDFWAIAESCP
ncbi:MAG: triose-phosphate isomerase [Alphaproteobacteria bacterium]